MAGANGLPEEGNAQGPSLQAPPVEPAEAAAPPTGTAAVEAAGQTTVTAAVEAAGQTTGPLETAAVPGQLDASGLPAEGSFILQDPMLQS